MDAEPMAVDHDVATRARAFLGTAHDKVTAFGEALAAEGVVRGLIGPRELPRLWERHLLNSAALVPYLPETGTVVDVGSGAGLPGIVIACVRPDLQVVLVEPMERRALWLTEVADALDLSSTVQVVQRRAEELHGQLVADAVTARAVAPLDRLVAWTLPLVRLGGALLAMKGSRAQDEVLAAARDIERLGGAPAEIIRAETIPDVAPTGIVRIVRVRPAPPVKAPRRARRR